jgi:hypothetical protein
MNLATLISQLTTMYKEEGDKNVFIRVNDAIIPIDHVAYNFIHGVTIVAPIPTDMREYGLYSKENE